MIPRGKARTRKPRLEDDPAWMAKRAEEVARNRAAFEAEHGMDVDQYVAERVARTRPFRDLLLGKASRRDPFVALGLPPNATAADVRKAFRQRAGAIHPDKGGSADAFVKLESAYRDALALAELRRPGAVIGGEA